MEDVGLELQFTDINSTTAFGSALRDREAKAAHGPGDDVRIVLREDRMNMDTETILLIVKSAGSAAATIAGFLKVATAILKSLNKPSVSISFKGRRIELFGEADESDLMDLARVLAGQK